jgi:hypothetical protein
MRKLTAAVLALGFVGGMAAATPAAGDMPQTRVATTQRLLCVQLSMPPHLCRPTA